MPTNSQMDASKTATIVACRLASSRLPRKALLPIQGIPSVERCLRNCLRFEGPTSTVLATSTAAEDAVLADYTMDGRVLVWRGDSEDVIHRYLGACDAFGFETIVRVTADCPVVSPEIAKILLEAHASSGADYTAARHFAVGSNSEVYRVEALRRVLRYKGRAEYSEYMSWYMTNNPDIFRLNFVDLPPDLVRDYRLTLDFREDHAMFEQLFALLEAEGREPFLRDVFSILDQHPELANSNKDLPVRYRTDAHLIAALKEATRLKGSC